MSEPTQQLASFFASTGYDALPANVIHEAKRAIVDGIGVGLGGVDHPSSDILMAYCARFAGVQEAQVWGRKDRLPAELAALVNGHQEHVLDFDDTYLPPETVLHGTVPVLPALLAVGEVRHLSGKDVLRGFVLGFEAEARLSLALGAAHYTGGWHVTSTTGPVGGAVAVGTMIGLSELQIRNAIGIAVTHSGGVTAMLGSMSKPYHAGKAAEAGVRSALLAEMGFDSAAEPLNHPQGYLNVATSDRRVDQLLDRLGERYILLENGYKPYASGVVSHPIIDAMVILKKQGLTADRVAKIEATVNPFVPQVTGQKEPETGLAGKFSTYHCAAMGLLEGTARKAQFTDAKVNEPAAVELRRKVVLIPDESIRKDECRVVVTLNDGSKLECYVPHATGTADNPVSDQGFSEKFEDLSRPVIGERTSRVLELLWVLETVDDVAGLSKLLSACAEDAESVLAPEPGLARPAPWS